ncbi:hypothetical protein NC653_040435 [Populus alba x Populus x berolinensis]|uniref:Uncharacterized protein n=1 Tax=Populus alba x Populus x berolinensis TaxID=444605 RepID=A0AAD6PSM5_9ROSI|nr:hypothetical protein NC653_040435 [Populus alba x Populus x berolinensis]
MGYWFLSLDLKQENLPLISPPTVHVLRHQWEYSCEKAKTELGYNPRSLEDGLKEVLPWFEEPWGDQILRKNACCNICCCLATDFTAICVHHEKYFYTEYERSKVAADNVASQAAAEGLPIVTLYPGVVYGPGKLPTGNALAKMLRSSTCSSHA